MIRGRVVGEIWATRKNPGLEGRKLLLITPLSAESEGRFFPSGGIVVAIDTLDAKAGQEVMVSFGSGARNVLIPVRNRHLLLDAAVSMVMENPPGVL